MLRKIIRLSLIAALTVALCQAERIKLYIVGGGHQLASEYSVEGDRVRYYSLERSTWEEIPLDLVDLERTAKERERTARRRATIRAEDDRERAARRKARTELHSVPIEDGVYYRDTELVRPMERADFATKGSQKRTLLAVFAPVPVARKQTIELKGTQSAFAVNEAQPQLYVRLEKLDRLALARLTVKDKSRVVQTINRLREVDEMMEEHEDVEVFRQQLAKGVYKIWPVEPLQPGEYALIEYSPGAEDLRVWDFSFRPATGGSS